MMKKSTNPPSKSDAKFLRTLSASSMRNLLPRSFSSKQNRISYAKHPKLSNTENIPPPDPNVRVTELAPHSSSTGKSSPNKSPISSSSNGRSDVQQQLIKADDPELDSSDKESSVLDPAVKVLVRIRPGDDGEANKVSSDALVSVNQNFVFDGVIDSDSSQDDVFRLVGVSLIRSALAGYNSSILSHGQTGSGKTYTLWGPPSAMVEHPSSTSQHGVVPRIFQMLFDQIHTEQQNLQHKINYQCRCSFLEIYNEQIGDLLDPLQRNLLITDDAKNGVLVENLSEEYVNSYEDATQILIKGLSNRKVGATSMNSKSSRSHVIFTFIVESWCKEASSKGFSSSKISKITFVDLAATNGRKRHETCPLLARETKTIKGSLAHLGHLVYNFAQGSEKSKNLSRKGSPPSSSSSSLAHLLQESVGGNARLTVLCSVSPHSRHCRETRRTLRFGKLARCVKNEPVVNEISENHVNALSDQIRQLKEELLRAKSTVHNSVGSKNGYLGGRNARGSLNQLRISLNRSLLLSCVENDSVDEARADEADADGADVLQLCQQFNEFDSNHRQEDDEEADGRNETGEETKLLECRSNGAVNLMSYGTRSRISIRSSLCSSKIYDGSTQELAASLHRGLQILECNQQDLISNKFKPVSEIGEKSATPLCASCRKRIAVGSPEVDDSSKRWIVAVGDGVEADNLGNQIVPYEGCRNEEREEALGLREKEELVEEIRRLRTKLKTYSDSSSSEHSVQQRGRARTETEMSTEELARERQRWTEMESDWISLTDELRIDLENNRRRAEKFETELGFEKKNVSELDDTLQRAVLGHARMIEHYAELQEQHEELVAKHRAVMGGIAEVKKAASRAGARGGGRFAKLLAAELSALRVERERERELLNKENTSLRTQLRDTAEAVHAAGELLVRLREAEEAAAVAQEKFGKAEQDNEKLRKQMEKLTRKHKMEMITMKQYLAEIKLPEPALQPLYRQEHPSMVPHSISDDDHSWRAEFQSTYKRQY